MLSRLKYSSKHGKERIAPFFLVSSVGEESSSVVSVAREEALQ